MHILFVNIFPWRVVFNHNPESLHPQAKKPPKKQNKHLKRLFFKCPCNTLSVESWSVSIKASFQTGVSMGVGLRSAEGKQSVMPSASASVSCCSSRDTFRGGTMHSKLRWSSVGSWWKVDTGCSRVDAADDDCCEGLEGPELWSSVNGLLVLPFMTQVCAVSFGKGSSVQRNASMGPFVLLR